MKKANIKIRKAKKSELERCQKIIYDCIRFVKINKKLKALLFDEYKLENLENAWKDVGIYVSEKNGFIRGTGRLEKTGEIKTIYVDPDFHKLNFGKTMIEKMESLAKQRGYKKVCVHALRPARGFYRKLGFKKERKLKEGTYYMEKRLRCG